MAKKGKKGDSKSAAKQPKCTCDHPFKCTCGNRPERPSKGHKWYPETQEWAGKGHKQKGASGQTSSVSQAAKTTSVGKTEVAQWQRLPSQLLEDICQRQKRPRAKFKNLESHGGKYKYRVIVPDGKDPKKDLFFVPAQPVGNEEQAKEEAALLALLEMTPSLPHERKLPDPYRTTWLHAIEQAKSSKSKKVPGKKQPEEPRPAASKRQSGAVASTSLTSASAYSSQAEKRRVLDEKRQKKNARIRRHENIRLANLDHPVFMSAQIRKHLEALLRGENIDWKEDEEADMAEPESEIEGYVLDCLHAEGFTRRHVRTAWAEVTKTNRNLVTSNQDDGEKVYESILQWLLVHLDEDQLPEGFDPRGRTLDVVSGRNGSEETDIATRDPSSGSAQFAARYGLSIKEISWLDKRTKRNDEALEDAFWFALENAAGFNKAKACDDDEDANRRVLQEEIEALEAIYADECKIVCSDDGSLKTIEVKLEGLEKTLHVVVRPGAYPSQTPERVWVTGRWPQPLGSAVHIELLKFLMEQVTPGEPMVFELQGRLQDLLAAPEGWSADQSMLIPDENKQPLVPANCITPTVDTAGVHQATRETSFGKAKTNQRRPRERRTFWSKPPSKTPAATAFPQIPSSMDRVRRSLPAAAARGEFLRLLKEADNGGRVLLVTGDTGCGKTTQIPQFILEESPKDAKIVVAQPRRLAATGVATRVANERGEEKAGVESVGYVVRGDSALCDRSRLVFCTTGVLLRQLQSEGALDSLTHIVVDEVHERNLDTDILLGLLRKTLSQYPRLRVILMSATLDADRFAAYWGENTPRMHIPGRTFPVTDYTLEDVLSLTGYIPRKNKKKNNGYFGDSSKPRRYTPWADSEKSDDEEDAGEGQEEESHNSKASSGPSDHGIPIEELIKRVDETSVDYDMLAQLVKRLVLDKGRKDDGSILVFLPGAPEINNAIDTIKRCIRDIPISVLPLHGGLQPKDQNLVFRPAESGFTKVILSTNVAETSITIPDCTIVIDTAREKQSSYDPANRMPLLVEHFAARANLKQRRGRAGRVRQGTCYKLISKATLSKLREHGEPEICRCALEQTLLSLLYLGVETGSGTFMSTLLDPPSVESLQAAATSLLQIGAVSQGPGENELILTPLGVHLAGIPAPPTVGKMLVMGSILGCRDAALAMAAGMSIGRSPFLRVNTPRKKFSRNGDDEKSPMEDMKQESILKERAALFQAVGASDHAFIAAVYMKWNETGTGGGGKKRFCESLGLSFNGMRDVAQLVRQLSSSLVSLGFSPSPESNQNGRSWRIIRACAVSAMAPSQLVKVVRPAASYHETAEGAKEKDGQARELKFFIRTASSEGQESVNVDPRSLEERVFIHPSSANFSTGSYSCPWLVYHSMVRTSKPFLRDVTECNAYPLLLFGGNLEVQASKNTVVVGNWVKLAANARIGSLMGGLRQRVDFLLSRKVENPSFDIANTKEMKLIFKLITTDGLGTM